MVVPAGAFQQAQLPTQQPALLASVALLLVLLLPISTFLLMSQHNSAYMAPTCTSTQTNSAQPTA